MAFPCPLLLNSSVRKLCSFGEGNMHVRGDSHLEVGLVERLGRRIEQLRCGLVLGLLERVNHRGEQGEFSPAEVRRRQLQQQVVHGQVRVGVAQVGETASTDQRERVRSARASMTTSVNVLEALNVVADGFQDILVVVVPLRGLFLAIMLLVRSKLGEQRRVEDVGLLSHRHQSWRHQSGLDDRNAPSSERGGSRRRRRRSQRRRPHSPPH